MKKIAYIEIDTHAEVALAFKNLMSDSMDFQVDYYFSKKILRQIGNENSENIFLVTPENLYQELSKKSYDAVIIGTVHRYFDVFEKVVDGFHTSIITHNLNFMSMSNTDLLMNIFKKDRIFRLKLLFKEGLLKKNKIYQNAQNILVLEENLGENTLFMPLFYCEHANPISSSHFSIVIPGSVSQERRDYFGLIEKLKQFSFSTPTEVVFLGKAQGRELALIQDLERRKIHHLKLQYFTEKVPEVAFQNWMKKASVLCCPLQKETEFFSGKEVYGISKVSGNIGDAIRYGKIAIFSPFYPSVYPFIITDEINSLEDLKSIIESHQFDFKKKFSKQMVSEGLKNVLKRISL